MQVLAASDPSVNEKARQLMRARPGTRDQWVKFLKIGNRIYALDMLKVAGADMTTPKPIEDAMALFEQLLKELEELLKS
jgi:oligoendopeptidase F